MDWNDVPQDVKGTLEVTVWHELVEEKKELAWLEVPDYDPSTPTPSVTTVWPSKSSQGDFQPRLRYSHGVHFLLRKD